MTTRDLVVIGGIILAIALLGIVVLWDFVFGYRHDTVLAITIFAIGVITFFGILRAGTLSEQPLAEESLRTAIAASLVMTYLFLATFLTVMGTPSTVGAISQSYIESFTNIVGITIAFYFGASAAVQVFGKPGSDEEASTPDSEAK